MEDVLVAIIAYLLGSLDFGVFVPRLMGVDIYARGSGNPGASNVLRTLGKKVGALVLAGDMLKGVAAAAIGDIWLGGSAGFVAGFFVVLGHAFPVWFRFKGGKGVATALGAVIWLEPVAGIALAVVWTLIVIGVKTASIGSLVVVAGYVPAYLLTGREGWSLVWAGATAGLVLVRHAPNISRLISGTESRVTSP